MKFITTLLLTALLGFAMPLYFAWWSFAVSSFIIALFIHQKGFAAFIAGFLGMFLLWMINMMIIDNANQHILSTRIAALLKAPGSLILILITALIAGLISGFASLSGSLARKLR